ncbi:MAG TPA: SPOR domain-containing protein [Campylobacterales bacterium]|nr:SPOR domain-containing protein [Campylobacterales bacterium]
MEDKLEKLKRKNDLSDIILEKDSSNGDNIKKLLLLAASLVLLFLIVLIGMKMFNNSNISPSENLASIGESIEQTSDSLADNVKTTVDETSDALFKKEAIIDENSETDLKFEEMVRKLKEQDALENQDIIVKDVDVDLTAVVDIPQESVVDKIKEITPQPIEKTVAKSPVIVQTITPTVVAKSTPRITTTPQPKEVINDYTPAPTAISSISGYFIQVGATSKSFPDRRFLQKIKNNGYDYIVHKVIIKGSTIKKVLVGPYQTRDQARNDLNSVQTTINPSAYIYRIK